MKTKQTKRTSSAKIKDPSPKLLLCMISGTIAVVLFAIVVGGYFIHSLWVMNDHNSTQSTRNLIFEAVENLTRPAPIEAQTGKVYIPDAKLVLPAPTNMVSTNLRYWYIPAVDKQTEELHVVDTVGLRNARATMISASSVNGMFNGVPQLQACNKGYLLSFEERTSTTNSLQFTKQLANGQTLYGYHDKGCATNQDFEDYIKQIDSY